MHRQRRLTAAGVEYVALDLALVDEGRDLRLRLAQTPRRPSARELRGLTAIGGIEVEVEFLCVQSYLRYINLADICQHG